MIQFRRYSLLVLVYLVLIPAASAQTSGKHITTLSGEKVAVLDLEHHIREAMDSMNFPGLSMAIINEAEIVYHNTFGVCNIESQEPVTKQTIFEAASLSKPLFAYFTMKMVEQGKLDLDKPIYPYLQEIFPPDMLDSTALKWYKTITPRIVLSHGTGLPNWAKGKLLINFAPGTGFSYSGEAYQHLGAALGTKLGIGWGSKLDSLFLNQVAHPLKMHNSFYTWNDKLEKHKAKGHRKGVVNLDIHRDKKVGPGYSLHSEALDYARFLIEMMEPKQLKKDLIAEMLKEQNHFKADNKLIAETGQTGWGLGFAQKPTAHGLMHLHTGNNHDFQAYAMFVPAQKYGFVLFGNADELFDLLQKIEEIIGAQF